MPWWLAFALENVWIVFLIVMALRYHHQQMMKLECRMILLIYEKNNAVVERIEMHDLGDYTVVSHTRDEEE